MSEESDYLFALKLQQQLNAETHNDSNNVVSAEQAPLAQTTNNNMSANDDFEFALKLQATLDAESDTNSSETETFKDKPNSSNNRGSMAPPAPPQKKNARRARKTASPPKASIHAITPPEYLNQTQNIVHPEWEIIDPTPDVHGMFMRFNGKFFNDSLGAVMVEWSKRMFSCAGICYMRSNRYSKTIIIRLSEPLLKLRPRKDLVETLLHEMIHAYYFVLNVREGNGGHGPQFKRMMNLINQVAGTNITVYHTFNDEVAAYKTHVWRCNGICQNHNPFHGFVKRTSNRAPGPNDQWWERHHRDCGGTFMKISEPEKPKKSNAIKKAPAEKSASKDIRGYFGDKNNTSNVPAAAGSSQVQSKDNNTRGVVGGHLGNLVFGLRDLSGEGISLNGKTSNETSSSPPKAVDRNKLREHWSKKFTNTEDKPENQAKRRRISNDSFDDKSESIAHWESYDDDVMIANVSVPLITILDSDDESDDPHVVNLNNSQGTQRHNNRSINIKREVLEDESSCSEDDIIMIDDEYDDDVDDVMAATELANQSVIDDIFGEDTLLAEFQKENDVIPGGSREAPNSQNDITSCPICFEKMKRSQFGNHLEGCSITIKVPPPSFAPKSRAKRTSASKTRTSTHASPSGRRTRLSSQQILKNCGYAENEIAQLDLNSSNESLSPKQEPHNDTANNLTPRQLRQRNLHKFSVQCPHCGMKLLGHQLDAHKSNCAAKKRNSR